MRQNADGLEIRHIRVEDSGVAVSYPMEGIVFAPSLFLVASTLRVIRAVFEEGLQSKTMEVFLKNAKGIYEVRLLIGRKKMENIEYSIRVAPGNTTERLVLPGVVLYEVVYGNGGIRTETYTKVAMGHSMPGFFGILIDHDGFLGSIVSVIRDVLMSDISDMCYPKDTGLNMIRVSTLNEFEPKLLRKTNALVTFCDSTNAKIRRLYTENVLVSDTEYVGEDSVLATVEQCNELFGLLESKNIVVPIDGIYFSQLRDSRVSEMQNAFEFGLC